MDCNGIFTGMTGMKRIVTETDRNKMQWMMTDCDILRLIAKVHGVPSSKIKREWIATGYDTEKRVGRSAMHDSGLRLVAADCD